MSAEASTPARKTSIETVDDLIRLHLNFDPERRTHRPIATKAHIVATHGSSGAELIRLAQHGVFTSALASIRQPIDPEFKKFYTTPNIAFEGWSKSKLAKHIAEITKEVFDSFVVSATHSEINQALVKAEQAERERSYLASPIGTTALPETGSVVAFNSSVLHGLPELKFDEELGMHQLVFSYAPILSTIEGIYPVDAAAELSLRESLAYLKTANGASR